MFIRARVPQDPWITVAGVDDCGFDYVDCQGKPWMVAKRQWIAAGIKERGGNACIYFVDPLNGNGAMQGFLIDAAAADGSHVKDADNSAVWLANAGVTIHVPILTHNPTLTIPLSGMDGLVKSLAKGYASARPTVISRVVWLIGLECERNLTVTNIQTIAASIRTYAGANAEIWAGGQNLTFLQAVQAADPKIGAWKEQDGSLPAAPLTMATAPAYIAEVKLLKPGIGGEFMANQATRKWITAQFMVAGLNQGCGET